MAEKPTSKKAKTAKPKAPPVLYAIVCKQGDVLDAATDPEEIESGRDDDDRVARYKFDGFVEVEFKTTVTDVAA